MIESGGKSERKNVTSIDKLYDTFMDSIHPDFTDEGLTQTQEGTVRDIITTLNDTVKEPDKIVKNIVESKTKDGIIHDGDLWVRLEDLMDATETITGKRVKYTPSKLVESLEPLAKAEVAKYKVANKEKGGDKEQKLSSDQKTQLKSFADSVLLNPAFVDEHINKLRAFHQEYYDTTQKNQPAMRKEQKKDSERAVIAKKYIQGQGNIDELSGMMRSLSTCDVQSEELRKRFQKEYPTIGFVQAQGMLSGFLNHETVFAFPDLDQEQRFKELQKEKSYPIVSLKGAKDFEVPSLDDVTVIDATSLQFLDGNAFLEAVPFSERAAFVKEISPGSFSDSGIFVDSYTKYIHFLGQLGVKDIEFVPVDKRK